MRRDCLDRDKNISIMFNYTSLVQQYFYIVYVFVITYNLEILFIIYSPKCVGAICPYYVIRPSFPVVVGLYLIVHDE